MLVHFHNFYDNNLTIDQLELEAVPRKGEEVRINGKAWEVLEIAHVICPGYGTHAQEIHVHLGAK